MSWHIIPNKVVNSTSSLFMKAELSQVGVQPAASLKRFLAPDCF
jgi:hypothetical protein